jgi:hypothetical protein
LQVVNNGADKNEKKHFYQKVASASLRLDDPNELIQVRVIIKK